MQNARTSWTADDLGPAMVAFLRPCPGVEAIVVVDNVALGAAIGGLNGAERSLERRRRARRATAA